MARRVNSNSTYGYLKPDDPLLQKQNEIVAKWTPKVLNALRSSSLRFTNGKTQSFVIRDGGKQSEKKLRASLSSKISRNFGVSDYIGFSFERHGVFVHKGVGRGYQSTNGIVTRTAKNPAKIRERQPDEWFNPVIGRYVPELADKIAEINADAAVNATRMQIR